MARTLGRTSLQTAALLLVAVAVIGCGVASGSSIEFKPAAAETPGGAPAPGAPSRGDGKAISPRLGFVHNGEATALENGGRVPLGDDKVAEVFISPYPPDWRTDLHLFLLDNQDFKPVTDVEVDLTYEMVYMDHGIDTQRGSKIDDGHYVLPLSFLMYGDWSVDVKLDLPEGKKHLRFIVKFFP